MCPVIETDRLVLRGHTIEDFADSYAMWSDPVVTRFIGGTPSTQPQSWSRVLSYVGHWQLMGFGYWVIEQKAGSRFIGEIGFANFRRNIHPAMTHAPEMGWALVPHAHGHGFATEAAVAATAWGDERFDRRTVCLIDSDNAPSIRLAAKLGFVALDRVTMNLTPVDLYERVILKS